MVQIHPDPPIAGARARIRNKMSGSRLGALHIVAIRRTIDRSIEGSRGAIAQLGERLPCTQEVGGSIPPGSTSSLAPPTRRGTRKARSRRSRIILEFLHLAFMALEHEKSPGSGKLLFNNAMK